LKKTKKGGRKMGLLAIVYVLIFIVVALVLYAVMQIKLLGLKVKDFWDFIEANEMLDKLNKFAKQYQAMSPQEQVIYLTEAEKIFTAFDKVPEELWDEEYEKYKQVLKKYNDIRYKNMLIENRNENDFINGNYIAVYMMNIKYKDFI